MNLKRFRSDANILLERIVRKAPNISAAEAEAYADLAQGLVLVTSAMNKLPYSLRSQSSRQVPHGTFGCWDYPNALFKVAPTEADIPELCRQKLMRDPKSGLFSSHEKTREWFVTKGWISLT